MSQSEYAIEGLGAVEALLDTYLRKLETTTLREISHKEATVFVGLLGLYKRAVANEEARLKLDLKEGDILVGTSIDSRAGRHKVCSLSPVRIEQHDQFKDYHLFGGVELRKILKGGNLSANITNQARFRPYADYSDIAAQFKKEGKQ
jgi:hypothetical protein